MTKFHLIVEIVEMSLFPQRYFKNIPCSLEINDYVPLFQGSKKASWNPSFPLTISSQILLALDKFYCSLFFFWLVGRLSWTLAHWASDHCRSSTSCTRKLLAQLENLLVPDFNLDGTFFEFCNVLQLMNVVTTQVLWLVKGPTAGRGEGTSIWVHVCIAVKGTVLVWDRVWKSDSFGLK